MGVGGWGFSNMYLVGFGSSRSFPYSGYAAYFSGISSQYMSHAYLSGKNPQSKSCKERMRKDQ